MILISKIFQNPSRVVVTNLSAIAVNIFGMIGYLLMASRISTEDFALGSDIQNGLFFLANLFPILILFFVINLVWMILLFYNNVRWPIAIGIWLMTGFSWLSLYYEDRWLKSIRAEEYVEKYLKE